MAKRAALPRHVLAEIVGKTTGTKMKTIRIAFLISIVWTGCTHNHMINLSAPETYTALNKRALFEPAVVTLVDGQKITAHNLCIKSDSTIWSETDRQTKTIVGNDQIAEIRFVNSGRGGVEGLGLGLLCGALTGAALGLADGDDPQGFISFSAEAKAVMGGIILGGIGGVVGIPVGIASGSKDAYHPARDSSQLTGESSKMKYVGRRD